MFCRSKIVYWLNEVFHRILYVTYNLSILVVFGCQRVKEPHKEKMMVMIKLAQTHATVSLMNYKFTC